MPQGAPHPGPTGPYGPPQPAPAHNFDPNSQSLGPATSLDSMQNNYMNNQSLLNQQPMFAAAAPPQQPLL